MENKLLQIPCELIGSQTKSISKTTKLTFESQENVSSDLISQITNSVGKIGWLAFLPEEIQPESVANLPPLTWDKDEKSPSQRLRGVLYALYEQQEKGKYPTFQQFYTMYLEKIIDQIKEKLT